MKTATLNVFGDVLTVYWTGSVWQAPCNGTQHARVKDAMREELRAYLGACGDSLDGNEELLENIKS